MVEYKPFFQKWTRPFFFAICVFPPALFLPSCSSSQIKMAEYQNLPESKISCPLPSQAQILTDQSTYRDLAESRIEALAGWRDCHAALTIVNGD